MARHSAFNSREVRQIAGASLLPFRTSCKGPVNTSKISSFEEEGEDIIDEAISYYRANVLFRNYEIHGGADRILLYLTLYISACLAKIEKTPNPKDAEKALQVMAFETFPLPGQAGFPFSSFFDKADKHEELEELRAYMKQLREETGQRVCKVGFTPEGKPNKFWTAFAKRKFMNCAI
uniref:Actin-related protein 2/3 complex subunit 3 n=1 Tax=Hemiselmis andersenii TaxID=464988 RepID=A0A6U2BHX2_HEMAN|mmetsp:Transcript_16673/g.38468  ORF Transcript_16673/g.38468 Transcript_16673/m.38468 type:complete len:178 (+) Transcript_16673:122-655(+)